MDLKDISNQVATIARKTGAYIKAEAKGITLQRAAYKGINDLVTYVDKESERRIVEELSQILPEADILAEEGNYKSKNSNLKWIIDPLDGTTNFVHGIPAYAISIALVENDIPIVAVVFDVEREECFTAYSRGGSFLNNEKIEVSKSQNLSECLMATGFPVTTFDKSSLLLQITESFIRETHGVRRIGSAALDLAYVSCGRFEGFFEYNLNAWDVAAGVLLVKEAGGFVSDFKGENNYLFGKEILAANAAHPEMLKLISKDWK
ncbi:MAG: inositol monophosphatase family protein [Cytophagales bacterium]